MNRIWRGSVLFTICVTLVALGYAWVYYGALTERAVKELFGVVAVIVIAPSLFLSGLAYFFDVADKYIPYRKSLGLLGLYAGLVHIGLSIITTGIASDALALESAFDTAMVVGYLALVLFALMPLFSNVWTLRRIGSNAVRCALRYLGYSAYILVLYHMALIQWDRWVQWCTTYEPLLPPPALVAFVIGSLTILMRVALFAHKALHPKRSGAGS